MSGFGELDLVNAMMERVNLDAGIPASAALREVSIGDVTLAIADMPANGVERGVALLIPGFTSSRGTFYPMFQMLADQGFRVISFSQRGQPGSSGGDTPADYPLETLGADVHKLADALGLSLGIHLLGHSFGGVVGIEAEADDEAVLLRPEQVAGATQLQVRLGDDEPVLRPAHDLEAPEPIRVAVLQAAHDAYRSLNPGAIPGLELFVDGRNAAEREPWERAGIGYVGIGR